jgi:hypothetical protein
LGFARQRDDDDATQCQQCQLGETTSIEGAARCDVCDAGTFGKTNGVCAACPIGFYQDSKGNIECVECTLGESYVDAKTACRGCDIGTFGSGNGCAECPIGFYQDSKGKKECMSCPIGTMSNIVGAARCDVCDAGTFGKTNGVCAACPTGFYQDGKGEIECRDSCAVSEAVPNKQGTACEYPRTTCGQGTVRVEMAQPSEYQFECNPNVLMSTGATLKSSTLVAVVVATSMMPLFAF